MPEEQNEHKVRAFFLNKKEDYERDLETGRDGWKEEVEGLISLFQNEHDSLYKRRKEIEPVRILYAEGKMWELLQEAKNSYVLGHYYSTIALSGMATGEGLL